MMKEVNKTTPAMIQNFNSVFERFVNPLFSKIANHLPQGFTARNVLLFSVFSLLFMGTMIIMSASMGVSDSKGFETYKFIKNQLFYVCLSSGLLLVVRYYFQARWLFNNMTMLMMLITIGLLIAVLIFGADINGAKRWISLGFINFQPSELAKFTVAIFISDYVVRRAGEVRESIVKLARLALPVGLVLALVFLAPDLGATAVIVATCMMIFFLAGSPFKPFLFSLIGALILFGGAMWAFPYRRARLLSFIDPFEDPMGAGLQLSQSLIAFGRGEWTGVGLGNSLQKLAYLPEAHTDFLLAIGAEELGFLGISVIFILSFMLVVSCMRIGHNALVNHYMRLGYLCYGIATIFLLQIFVNAGMNMGILPTKGLTLPFMSYGGSSLIVSAIMVGIVWRTDAEVRNHSNNEML